MARWIAELARDYAEAGLHLPAAATGPGRATFDEAMADVVEDTKPAVVSFQRGRRSSPRVAAAAFID